MEQDREISILQQKHIEAFKIPVDSWNPATYWIISLDNTSEMPTDEELKMLQSYAEYLVRTVFKEHYASIILAKPLLKDVSFNTRIFKKLNGNWFYRKGTWEHGYFPFFNSPEPELNLVQVMDNIETIGDVASKQWLIWKKERPELFHE